MTESNIKWMYVCKAHSIVPVEDLSRCSITPSCPSGMMLYILRRGRHEQWEYRYYGATKRECWLRASEYERKELEKLKQQVQLREQRILERYGPEPEDNR
jgi:hypothetical protein